MERRLIDAKEGAELMRRKAINYASVGKLKEAEKCAITADILNDNVHFPTISAVQVVRCRECKRFREYSEEYKATVENADGDCAIRKWYSDDEQLYAVTKDDYCSLGARREPDGE